MYLAVPSLLLSYQLGGGPAAAHLAAQDARRAAAPAMEYRLNNYILPGPMQPLNNNVLVKLRKVDETTSGGLFVPTADTEKPKEGVVVAAGPGNTHPTTGALLPCPVKEGDLVLLRDFTGQDVDYNGQKHLFVDAGSLLGCFEGGTIAIDAFRPIGENLMVSMTEAATETTTGIALAGMDDDDANLGQVVAVGPGKTSAGGEQKAVAVTPGESVMYQKRAGAETNVEGKRFKIVAESDCLAKW